MTATAALLLRGRWPVDGREPAGWGSGYASNVQDNPLLAHLGIWFCAWSEQSLPLQLSPPLGAVVR